MCGIVGVGTVVAGPRRQWLAAGRDALIHRGPDDAGEWWSSDGRVGFAHRRLSIIDLSSAGGQPMLDPAGSLCIVFNGEIYNFRELRSELIAIGYSFRSQSDTEVLLACYREWGSACIARLNGAFAFALYDAQRQSILLARDRAGEKPLFYRYVGSELRFGSELKALLADPDLSRQIDPSALDCYLAMGYVPGDLCILQGFNKLPPAHALEYDLCTGKARVWRYWEPPQLKCEVAASGEASLLDELESLLEDAVRIQMLADVPVGVLLSGGVDSSLVTAMALRASGNVRTFTIGFPGAGKSDETEHARLIARHFGTRHTELMAEDATAELLPRLARQFDEPMVDSSMIPTFLVSQLVKEHCAVALGGDGGDELFGGYPHYSRLLWIQKYFFRFPDFFRTGVARLAAEWLPVGFKGRNWVQGLSVNLKSSLPLTACCFDANTRRRLLRDHGRYPRVAEVIWRGRVPKQEDLLQRATRADFANYLAEDILVKVDRTSMLSSLEMRAPFLDYRIIEFAFGKVPSHLKATPTQKKILLKRLAERILPREFDRHRKQGFSIPLSEWLKRAPFGRLFNEVLRDPRCCFDRSTIDGILRGQEKGRVNGERLFSLVLFELWRREYNISV